MVEVKREGKGVTSRHLFACILDILSDCGEHVSTLMCLSHPVSFLFLAYTHISLLTLLFSFHFLSANQPASHPM